MLKNYRCERKIVLSSLTFLLTIILLIPFAFFNGALKAKAYEKNEVTAISECENSGIYLVSNISNDVVSSDEPFDLLFETNLTNFSIEKYEADGIGVLDCSNDAGCIFFNVQYCGEYEQIKLTVYIDNGTNNVFSTSVFGIKCGCNIFLSDMSFESAYMKYYKYILNCGEITDKEYQEKYDSIYHSCGETEVIYNNSDIALYGPTKTISGKLEWQDDQPKIHPLKYIKVGLFDATKDTEIRTTYTDFYGNYSFLLPITSYTSVKICVYAAGNRVQVLNADNQQYYYMGDALDIVSQDNITVNWRVLMTSETGQAFQIAQAMIFGYKYYNLVSYEVDDWTIGRAITVVYPHTNPKQKGCYYSEGSDTIYICDASQAHNDLRSYNSWDVLLHEYGHHVQYQNQFSASVGGSHNFVNALMDANGKDTGMKLAWSESYASVFSGMVQKYYYYSELFNIKYVGDTAYNSYNGANVNYETSQTETIKTTIKNGETCEATIIGILWDLYDDSGSSESFDNISFSDKDFFKLMRDSHAKTLYEFSQYFLSTQSIEDVESFAKILDYYDLTPKNVTANGNTFSWNSVSGTYAYSSKFQLKLYSETNYEFYASSIVSEKSMTVAKSIINNYLANGKVYVRIFGYDANSPESCFFSTGLILYSPRSNIGYSQLVRSAEYRITDSGYMANKYDTISLTEFSGYNLAELKDMGYKKITISISMNVYEINDGYQYIAIYNGESSSATKLCESKFEHGHLKKDKSKWMHSFTFTIALNDLSSASYYIRYNASGSLDDDWVTSDLTVKTVISQS